MKNFKMWIICALFLLVIGCFLCLRLKASFVTQPLENVNKIVVVTQPYHGGKNEEINITDQSEIDHVYKLLKDAKTVEVNKYPSHLSSLQFDPEFNVRIEYQNGKTDIYSAASPDAVFKRLDTVTSHGDGGYIRATSKELWEYVTCLQ